MKKYDLMILGVYLLLTLVALAVSITYMDPGIKMKKRAAHYVKSMYKEPVRVVSIRETDLPLMVVSNIKSRTGSCFRFEGTGMDPQDIYHCKVVNDTLYIRGKWNWPWNSNLVLYVAPGVQVDTVKAPRVQITVNR